MKPEIRATIEGWKARMVLPALCAPMFLVSGPDLVMAAMDAGIMAALPGPNGRTIEDLESWFTRIETHRAAAGKPLPPWAFNMITHRSYHRFDQELALVARFAPELVITALGGPDRVLDVVHAYGGLVFADVATPSFARKALDKGADGLVLVCSGAGGHTGDYALFALLDEVRRFFDGPLIVGGAISHGRAIRAVEVLGADFANLGTRFIPASESMVSPEYRQMVVECSVEDIVPSRAITGALGNWMKPSLAAAGINESALAAPAKLDFSSDMHENAKAWKHVWSAGHGVGAISAAQPMAEIVAQLVAEYRGAVETEARLTRFAGRAGA